MNTKPILFSTEMVQAILEGRKTQTRRIVKIKGTIPNNETKPLSTHSCKSVYHFWGIDEVACPYGSPGDILWVRECFNNCIINSEESFIYKADWETSDVKLKWKPSIHMPKEACRLFLKITNVRVERLKDITEMDAIFEGCMQYDKNTNLMTALYAFELLWKKINGENSWNSNPWVWVIEFEKVEKPENF